jgi:hypothetical protein
VDNFASDTAFSRFLTYRSATARFIYRSLCVLFFVGVLGGAAAGTEVPSAPGTSLGPSLAFSVADFDGDLKPDLANIEAGQSDVSRTDYRVQLQLSAAGRQTFQIVAPMGGLQIVAHDVNGDHALDLVLTTTWLRQPVAILLNDGHGSFSRVDPTAFPAAFSESKTNWVPCGGQVPDAVGVPPQSRSEIRSQIELFLHFPSQSGLAAFSYSRVGTGCFLVSNLGRAPPLKSFSLLNLRRSDK